MKAVIALLIIVGSGVPMSAELVQDSSIGHMPEVVVTAPRYEYEDVAWSGLVGTVVVTAPRYELEDVAWSGLMETVTVNASPYDDAGALVSSTGFDSPHSRWRVDMGSSQMTRNIGLFSYTIAIVVAGLLIALYVVLHSGYRKRRVVPCTCEHTR